MLSWLATTHHISNFTPCSGIVFVKNAAPMVDSCTRATPLTLSTSAVTKQAQQQGIKQARPGAPPALAPQRMGMWGRTW